MRSAAVVSFWGCEQAWTPVRFSRPGSRFEQANGTRHSHWNLRSQALFCRMTLARSDDDYLTKIAL